MLMCLYFMLIFGDTKVVSNDIAPTGEVQTLQFHQDLRIGGPGSEFVWESANTNLAITDQGEIVVADMANTRILLFSEKGQFIREIASMGSDTHQLDALDNIRMLNDGSLMVLLGRSGVPARFKYYDINGKFLREHKPSGNHIIRSCEMDPLGRFVAGQQVSLDRAAGITSNHFLVMDIDLQTQQTYFEYSIPLDPSRMYQADFLASFLARIIERQFGIIYPMAFDEKGRLYVARSDTYKITRWNKDLTQEELVVTKKHEPLPVTDDDIIAAAQFVLTPFKEIPEISRNFTRSFMGDLLEKSDIPKIKQSVLAILPMESGFMVVHDASRSTGVQQGHLFSEEGVFLGPVEVQNQALVNPNMEIRMIFKKGFAYTLETDAQGNTSIIRYRYSLVPAKQS